MIRIRRLPEGGDEAFPLAPMVDIVFLLILFFLVTGSVAGRREEISIHLPTADATQPISARAQEARIEIDARGQIFLDGEAVTLEILGARLNENRPRAAVLSVDRNAYHGSVIGVLSQAKAAGIENYAFEVVAGR